MSRVVTEEQVGRKILMIRGHKVLLDHDLAILYGVSTGNLNKALIRNRKRFPTDFCFQINDEEFKNLIFQFGISSWGVDDIIRMPLVSKVS